MKLFLRLKAWQIFLLVAVPMFLPMFLGPTPENFASFGAISWIWMVILVGWIYSVGNASNNRLPPSLQKNPLIYRLGFGLAVVYGAVLGFFIMPHTASSIMTHNPQGFPTWAIPLHLLSMAAMFYGVWFTAKQFATLQRQEELRFMDYSGPFFLFWFAPIGVWFLQPRINELLGSGDRI